MVQVCPPDPAPIWTHWQLLKLVLVQRPTETVEDGGLYEMLMDTWFPGFS